MALTPTTSAYLRQRKAAIWIIVFSMVALLTLTGCTSLKRFAYDGYKRDEWQQPEKVVATLEIAPGSQVADLGSGGGYFTFRLADAVTDQGMVYAVDVDEGLLGYIEETAQQKGYTNIQTILAKEDDPGLTVAKVDLVFLCNTYHHLANRAEYFANVKKYLKPGGRVAIIEFTSGWLSSIGHGTDTQEITEEMQQAGFKLHEQFEFLSKQNFLVFQTAN